MSTTSNIKVLLVEDDQIDQMAFERFLKEGPYAYDYQIASSVKEAIEKIQQQTFDVAIIDYQLGDGTGFEVIEKIQDVPVIFVTGAGDQSIAVKAMKAGVYDYLIKTASRDYLDYLPVTIDNALNFHRVQQKLAEAETEVEKLSWVASKTDSSISISDKNGRVEWVNDGFIRLTGYSLEEVKGTTCDFLRPDDSSGLNPGSVHFQEMLERKKAVVYEVMNESKDGRKYWTLSTLNPMVDERGELTQIIAIDVDISKQKETEQQLIEAKQKAEESAKAKEQFLANMSHEIRTPMNAIMGLTQILVDTEMSQDQKQYLSSIKFATDNLLALINDILDLSKIDAGKITFENVNINLHDIVKGLVDSYKIKAEEKKMLLRAALDQKIPKVLLGDPVRLNQILTNLVSNAIKFTKKGEVLITAKLKEKKQENVAVEFSVKDTGIGIPSDKLDKIFENFEQAQSDTTRNFGGTGLGLAISKQLVELQGGKIKVLSEEGKGATFSFSLSFGIASDISLEKLKSVEKIETDKEFLVGVKALLVEDNNLNQIVAKKFLNSWGMEVELAENGKVAIEKLEKNDYDIVLMDIQMPEMDGYQTAQHIRKQMKVEQKKNIMILAMTAHAFRGEAEKCIEMGMNGYLSKPLKKEDLFQKIAALVQKKN